MKTYLVGGAVRDALLKIIVKDKDYVVVGAEPSLLLQQGYKQVGKSFPVFLHPHTKEEYALARVEKKVGAGYYGFECDYSSNVTLEDDLLRRDLTINAIAQDTSGKYIDPFNGIEDLKQRKIKHVSLAFREDPVRVLRAARFAAKLALLGFTIDSSTLSLMYDMVKQGEVNSLIAERVWAETEKALQTDSPQVFFESLRECGALKVLWPELDALYGIPATKHFHNEIDTGIHTMMVLDESTKLSKSPVVRFAALVHDLGKGVTSFSQLPSHPGHAEAGAILVNELCDRLKIPNLYRDLAQLAALFHTRIHKCIKLSAESLVELLYELNAFRKQERFNDLLLVCQADAYGRVSKKSKSYPQVKYLQQAREVANTVSVQAIINNGAKGNEIKLALKNAQAHLIQEWIIKNKENSYE